jgi:hypothetical protein
MNQQTKEVVKKPVSATRYRVYQDAMDVQNACNLSGVVHSMGKAVTELWAEARENGEGTEYVNTHPVVIAYISKLRSLAGCTCTSTEIRAFETLDEWLETHQRLPVQDEATSTEATHATP